MTDCGRYQDGSPLHNIRDRASFFILSKGVDEAVVGEEERIVACSCQHHYTSLSRFRHVALPVVVLAHGVHVQVTCQHQRVVLARSGCQHIVAECTRLALPLFVGPECYQGVVDIDG